MVKQKNLNENIPVLTEQQRKYLGFLRKKAGEEKYIKIKTEVLGGFDYTSIEDGSKVIDALKKELNEVKEVKNKNMEDYITFEELLSKAHEKFEKITIETDVMTIQENDGETLKQLLNMGFVVRAKVTTEKGTYTAYGDASKENTTKLVQTALLRMAETRAVARCLRFATGVGKTAKEELSEDNEK